jgi:ABC-type multidrug transport system fused ATPase/permease subunit
MVMGRNIDNTDLIALSEQVGLAPFVLQLKDGYQTVLNPEAGSLNSSMVTLILLCRALLANPSLLLWDTHYQFLTPTLQDKVFAFLKQHTTCTVVLSATAVVQHPFVDQIIELSSNSRNL